MLPPPPTSLPEEFLKVVMADKGFMVSLQGQEIVGVLVVVAYFALTVLTALSTAVLKEGVHILRVVAVVQDRGCQVLTPLNNINYLTTTKQSFLPSASPCLSPGTPGSTGRSGRTGAWSIWPGRETS